MSLIERLSASAQSLGLEPTDDGAFTLKESGVYVHSTRSPLMEAQRLLGSAPREGVYILWGMGLGYHGEMLLKAGCTVIGVETRPSCVEALRKAFPLEKLHAFISKEPEKHIFSAIASLPTEEACNIKAITMRGSEPSPEARFLAEKGVRAQESSNRIYCYLMDSWYHHILNNLSAVSPLARYKENAFEGIPVILCSAGPSLRESLPHLRRVRSKAAFIAVDTAFTALVEGGIIPDFIHAVDAKVHNVGDFAGIPEEVFSRTALLADVTLSPIVTQKPWKHIELLKTVHPLQHPEKGFYLKSITLIDYLTQGGMDLCGLQTGGSVATSAFHYAASHGAKEIYLVGQDLAYSQNRGHSVGSPYDCAYRCGVSRLAPYDTIPIRTIPLDAQMVKGIGATVPSDPLLSQFRSWFEVSIADNQSLQECCINASEAGAFFSGWKHQRLSELSFEGLEDIQVPSPSLRVNPYGGLVHQALDLWEKEGSPLHKEYFYREERQKQHKEEYDPFLFWRKKKRMQDTLEKIRGGRR